MTNPRPATVESWLERHLEVTVGPVAHGGHFIARHEGRVIFVRHALTGERVVAVVTEDRGGSFCRADAVTVLQPDLDRVVAACHLARPGGCGGCDFQHITLPRQRELKAQVIAEQFTRLAGIDVDVEVQSLGDAAHPNADEAGADQPAHPRDGLGWRRRVRYAVTEGGQLGLRAHRSHRILEIDRCPLASPAVGEASAAMHTGCGTTANRVGTEIEFAQGDGPEVAVLGHSEPVNSNPGGRRRPGRRQPRTDARASAPAPAQLLAGPERLSYRVHGRRFMVRAGGFWQTHPSAAEAFTDVVRHQTGLRPGDCALDLYAGAGLFAALLGEQVGSSGRVLGLEADGAAVRDAAANLADLPQVDVRQGRVTPESVRALAEELGGAIDCVLLDPPRTGAGREVMQAITNVAGTVIYVACDPAALARDVRTAADAGWELSELRAFDAFPMTHHVEAIATLRRPSGPTGS